MSNKKDWMVERLSRLVKLCKSTEPDQPDDKHLFQPCNIDAHDLLVQVDQRYDEMRPREIKEIMVEANKIWKFRRKIWNGDVDWDWQSKLDGELEVFIKRGEKITAIKHYRSECEKETGSMPSLKESKDYVDKLSSTVNKKK
jgi:hypothetical protein